jgi:hypothetical protein
MASMFASASLAVNWISGGRLAEFPSWGPMRLGMNTGLWTDKWTRYSGRDQNKLSISPVWCFSRSQLKTHVIQLKFEFSRHFNKPCMVIAAAQLKWIAHDMNQKL